MKGACDGRYADFQGCARDCTVYEGCGMEGCPAPPMVVYRGDGSAAEIARLRADLAMANSELTAAHASWQADVARLNAEVAQLRADLATSIDNREIEAERVVEARVERDNSDFRLGALHGIVENQRLAIGSLIRERDQASACLADVEKQAWRAKEERDTAIRERDEARRDAAIARGLPSDLSSQAAQRRQAMAKLVTERDEARTSLAAALADLAGAANNEQWAVRARTAEASLAAALVRVEALESERDTLQHSLNEECVRRAVDVENLRAELGAALRARVDDLKAVTEGLASCTPAAAPRTVTREQLWPWVRKFSARDTAEGFEWGVSLVEMLADLGVTVTPPSGEEPKSHE